MFGGTLPQDAASNLRTLAIMQPLVHIQQTMAYPARTDLHWLRQLPILHRALNCCLVNVDEVRNVLWR